MANDGWRWHDGTTPKIAIIGAGASGVCMAIQLQERLGISSFTVFDGLSEIGGTWASNTYPGCACDVASHLYSFSFAPKHDWPEKYSSQHDIQKYLNHLVNHYNITQNFQLNTEVRHATWEPRKSRWKLILKRNNSPNEEEDYFHFLISGAGALRYPHIPEKYASFEGQWFHSSRWDSSCNLQNKTVAVIGSGASAVQIIPSIAPIVKHLYVFQRTPSWVVPRGNYSYSRFAKFLFKFVPGARFIYRNILFWQLELLLRGLKHTSFISGVLAAGLKKLAGGHLQKQVSDPTLRAKLTPLYDPGCKRITFSDDYLPAFSRENVTLITDHITGVENSAICTTDAKTDVDVLILATGFLTEKFIAPMKLTGTQGVDISEQWKDDPQAYLGILCSGFPNMFMLYGPGTSLGHNSIIFMIECQANYIVNLLRVLLSKNYSSVDVKKDAQQAFNEMNQANLKPAVFNSNCNSWYANKAGKVFALWGSSCVSYWRHTYFVTKKHFEFSVRDTHTKTQ